MDPDDPLRDELGRRRATLDERRRRLDSSLLLLEQAGRDAMEALQQAGISSKQVSVATGLGDSTIRRLNVDSNWRPLSTDTYVTLDGYLNRRLNRPFGLAELRRHYDRDRRAVEAAEREIEAAPSDVDEADSRPVRWGDGWHAGHDLGILLLPGVVEERGDRTLRRFGDALASLLNEGRDGPGPAVEVTAGVDQSPGAPPYLLLGRGRDGPDGNQDRDLGPRWLVTVSPVTHALDDRDFRAFFWWLTLWLPALVLDCLDRHAMKARCLPGAWLHRRAHAVFAATLSCLAASVTFISIPLLLLLLLATYVPGLRSIGRACGRLLLQVAGLAYAHANSATTLDAQSKRAARHLQWLRRYCRRVVVMAHGQGVPAAYRLIRQSPQAAAHFVTLGSPLRRFQLVRAFHGRAVEIAGSIGWVIVTLIFSLGLLIVALNVISVIVGQIGAATALGGFVGVLAIAVLTPLALVTASALVPRSLRGELAALRRSATEQLSDEGIDIPWTDFATAADLLADGAMLAATAPLGEKHVDVVHMASSLADHHAYLRPDSEALYRLVRELSTLAPPPATLAAASALVREPGARRRRVRLLTAARWASALSGLLAAAALTRESGAADARQALVFVVLWILCGTAAYVVLKGSWMLWDHAHRLRHVAPSGSSARPTHFHLYVGLTYFLELLVLAVVSPPLVMAGLWGDLLRASQRTMAFMVEGDPVLNVELVILALVAAVTFAGPVLGAVLASPVIHGWLERRTLASVSPSEAAWMLLRQLPQEGVTVGHAHYRVARISWDLSIPRCWVLRGQPFRSPATALALLRNEAVLLDLREGRVVDSAGRWKDAYVHGQRVYDAREQAAADSELRLAGLRDWRAFRHDLPEILEHVSDDAFSTCQPAHRTR